MTRKILVIDDERPITEVVRAVLQDRYDVATTTSAASAYKFMADNKFDLVLLDIRMPRIDGIEALKTIKEAHPDVTVIMLTAYDSDENREAANSLGAHGFVIKPFDIDYLRNYVDRALTGPVTRREQPLPKVP